MKRLLLVLGLLLMIVWGAGCVVISVGEMQPCIGQTADPQEITVCEIDTTGGQRT